MNSDCNIFWILANLSSGFCSFSCTSGLYLNVILVVRLCVLIMKWLVGCPQTWSYTWENLTSNRPTLIAKPNHLQNSGPTMCQGTSNRSPFMHITYLGDKAFGYLRLNSSVISKNLFARKSVFSPCRRLELMHYPSFMWVPNQMSYNTGPIEHLLTTQLCLFYMFADCYINYLLTGHRFVC